MTRDPIDTDYQPVSCARYDQYEIAILRRRPLRLVWDEDNVIYDRVVTPLNLRTAGGQEFLILRLDEDGIREVRLDRIRRTEIL